MLESGKYYHIYNRGNNREDLFKEEKNYDYFLKLYEYHIDPVAETFAYCLMKNHFHLLVKIKDQEELERLVKFSKNTTQVLTNARPDRFQKPVRSVSQTFSNFFNAYSKAINKAYNRTGSLFQRPFKKIEITSDAYFAHLVHYIHFNPQKHGFTDDFRAYPHSSYQLILSKKPTMLQRERVVTWFGGRNDFTEFHKHVSDEKEILKLICED